MQHPNGSNDFSKAPIFAFHLRMPIKSELGFKKHGPFLPRDLAAPREPLYLPFG